MSKIPSNLPEPSASSSRSERSSAVKKLASRVGTIARPSAPSGPAKKTKHSYSKESSGPQKIVRAALAKIKATKTKT